MIKNLWNVVKVVCGNHRNTPELVLDRLNLNKMQYICECKNTISVDDYDKVIKKISDEMEKAEALGINTNLKNMKWRARNIDYKIICFKEDKIVVKAVNRKIVPLHR